MPYIVLLLFLVINSWAQVNIEQYRSFDASGTLSDRYRQTVTLQTAIKRSTSTSYALRLDYFKPFTWGSAVNGFFISKINYGESNGDTHTNDRFYHLRFMASSMVDDRRLEAYFQYEGREFTAMDERYLVGSGLRYRWGEHIVKGTSILHEWYRESPGAIRVSLWRLSHYIQLKWPLNSFNTIDAIFYIQPKLFRGRDIRYFLEATYTSQLTQRIAYNATISSKYYNQSRVYRGVELFFNSGLKFKL
ncbi:MAG: hypothetical protein ACO3K7_05275 [Candidatus Marinamargulisbacteria bacterium]